MIELIPNNRCIHRKNIHECVECLNFGLDRCRNRIKKLEDLLWAYNQWEANFVINGDWSSDFGTLTQELYDELMELQTRRNKLLKGIKSGI